MVIKGNGAVNTMEAVKINTKEKERTKVTYHKSVFLLYLFLKVFFLRY